MSRMSIHTFLSKAKQSLSQSLRSKSEHPASFVIGNESADLDSITSALVYGYVQSCTPAARKADRYIIPVVNIHSDELRLRPELKALLKHAKLEPSDLVTLDDLGKLHESLPANQTDWTLVDHNVFQGTLGEHYSGRVTGVIDHHEDEGEVPQDAKPRIIEKAGSCSSHVCHYCQNDMASVQRMGLNKVANQESCWDAQVAKLALGSILIDTGNFKAEKKTTDLDRQAVEYLEGLVRTVGSKLPPTYSRDAFFKEISDAKSDLDDLSLEDILRKDYKQWTEGNLKLGISSAVKPMEYLVSKETNFVEEVVHFAKSRDLHLYAIMTASANDSGTFTKQLLLSAQEDGEAVEAAEKFVEANAKKLQLEDGDTELDKSAPKWVRLWEQKDLESSRKEVGPLLREAMG